MLFSYARASFAVCFERRVTTFMILFYSIQVASRDFYCDNLVTRGDRIIDSTKRTSYKSNFLSNDLNKHAKTSTDDIGKNFSELTTRNYVKLCSRSKESVTRSLIKNCVKRL